MSEIIKFKCGYCKTEMEVDVDFDKPAPGPGRITEQDYNMLGNECPNPKCGQGYDVVVLIYRLQYDEKSGMWIGG